MKAPYEYENKITRRVSLVLFSLALFVPILLIIIITVVAKWVSSVSEWVSSVSEWTIQQMGFSRTSIKTELIEMRDGWKDTWDK